MRKLALLNFVEEAADRIHDVVELMLGQVVRDQHRDNARQDLEPDLIRAEGITRLLVNLKNKHADFRVCLTSANLFERLENVELDGGLIDPILELLDSVKHSQLDLHVLCVLKHREYAGDESCSERLVVKRFEQLHDLVKREQLQLGNSALKRLLYKRQHVVTKVCGVCKLQEKLCVLEKQEEGLGRDLFRSAKCGNGRPDGLPEFCCCDELVLLQDVENIGKDTS